MTAVRTTICVILDVEHDENADPYAAADGFADEGVFQDAFGDDDPIMHVRSCLVMSPTEAIDHLASAPAAGGVVAVGPRAHEAGGARPPSLPSVLSLAGAPAPSPAPAPTAPPTRPRSPR